MVALHNLAGNFFMICLLIKFFQFKQYFGVRLNLKSCQILTSPMRKICPKIFYNKGLMMHLKILVFGNKFSPKNIREDEGHCRDHKNSFQASYIILLC